MICTNLFSPHVGGAEIVVQKIAEYFCNQYEVFVLTRRLPGRKRDSFPFQVVEYNPSDVQGFMKKLQKLYPALVLIYSDVFDFFRYIITSSSIHKLIIAPCGANWIYNNRRMANLVFRHANHVSSVICHSKCERDYKFYNTGDFASKLHIIPNGVNLEDFDKVNTSREELSLKYNIKKDKINIPWVLNVSNFFPGKGQEHLINILSTFQEDYLYLQISNDITFPIGKELETKWSIQLSKKKVKAKSLKNISRNDVIAFFKNSNVFAFTSEKEVAPIVLLEAMTTRLPWVATNVGNAQELKGGKCIPALKNSKFYSLFDSRIMKLFSQAIHDVWNMPIIGEQGRKQIEEELTWNRIFPQYENVINQCLN